MLGVARGTLHHFGADFSISGSDRNGVAGFVIMHAPGTRLLLPRRAKRIAVDTPGAVPDGAARRLFGGSAVFGPIDHAMPGFAGIRRRGGLQIESSVRDKRLEFGSRPPRSSTPTTASSTTPRRSVRSWSRSALPSRARRKRARGRTDTRRRSTRSSRSTWVIRTASPRSAS